MLIFVSYSGPLGILGSGAESRIPLKTVLGGVRIVAFSNNYHENICVFARYATLVPRLCSTYHTSVSVKIKVQGQGVYSIMKQIGRYRGDNFDIHMCM